MSIDVYFNLILKSATIFKNEILKGFAGPQ